LVCVLNAVAKPPKAGFAVRPAYEFSWLLTTAPCLAAALAASAPVTMLTGFCHSWQRR
jgi:hypothetical protein